jgi:2,5-furandicarboxylate decarboxylase 1
MSLRDFLSQAKPMRVNREVDPYLEIARLLHEREDRVIHFKKVADSPYSVVGNVCSSRDNFARALSVPKECLLNAVDDAMNKIEELEVLKTGPCQEIVENEVDLSTLPIPTYTSNDMGPYITSGVFIAGDPEYGLNASFHRASPISKNKLVARICKRNLYTYLERAGGQLPVAICIGLHPSILLAAAMPVDIGVFELGIANVLRKLDLVKCQTNDLLVPAEAEIVLEGRITKERHAEGPFLDITRTYDLVRNEPVIEITHITHRKNPIYQALLPASREHELLMGMPREPVIYNAVNRVCSCRNVLLTHGGCSWLHGVVQIKKQNADDGRKAIEAALAAHPSMKHVVVVDEDINIYDIEEVEWAIATRFLAGKDMIMKHEQGSSLDPCVCEDRMTYKLGLDATIPFEMPKEAFKKAAVGE